MKPVEKSKQKAGGKQLIKSGKLVPALQAYFEARDALFKQYSLDRPELKK